jgi:signal transduction histidine kinase
MAGARGSGVRAEGHGLGLFIARTVCRAMGGELFVERPERTSGARFAIEIRSEARGG